MSLRLRLNILHVSIRLVGIHIAVVCLILWKSWNNCIRNSKSLNFIISTRLTLLSYLFLCNTGLEGRHRIIVLWEIVFKHLDEYWTPILGSFFFKLLSFLSLNHFILIHRLKLISLWGFYRVRIFNHPCPFILA